MAPTLLKTLADEKVVLLNRSLELKLPFSLEGITRIVDKQGNTLALLLGKSSLDEVEEDLDSINPNFLASIDRSRRSHRTSGNALKVKAGLA